MLTQEQRELAPQTASFFAFCQLIGLTYNQETEKQYISQYRRACRDAYLIAA